MNTTMAEGARERCVAQIGEALFCRPGMPLDEIANRCMAERSRSGFEPILHDSIFDACDAERNRLRAEMDQVAGCLPGVYYMDPPDGGNVSIPEQVRRMSEDAANHRKAAQLAVQIVAWHWPSTGAVCSADAVERDRACTDNAVPLYAAPPAQAVDLGQFRQSVIVARSYYADWAGDLNDPTHKDVAECDRLLALIDSQAVGNG
ncbi:hypothetical protein [Stenotrophomonas maltophilia]